jgi:ankyrin repeat protein
LKAKTECNPTDSLFKIIECGYHPSLIKTYIEQGADLSAPNEDKKKLMQIAGFNGYFDAIKLIADIKNTDSNDSFRYRDALLYMMNSISLIDNAQYDCASSLLKAGAWTNAFFLNTNDTALHRVVSSNKPYLVSLLLSYGADTKAKNTAGQTPKEINPACFNEGWLINEYNAFIPGILIALCQGIRQNNHFVLKWLLEGDLSSTLLNAIAGGFIINKQHTIKNGMATLERTKITCLTEEYNKPRFWGDITSIGRAVESQALVKNLEQDKNSPDKVKQHIHSFFADKSLEECKKRSRLIDLMKKYNCIDEESISRYKDDKEIAEFQMM